MSTSGFLYRDILKYILPIAFFYLLFIPYVSNKIRVEELVGLSVITSFVLGCSLEYFAKLIFQLLPSVKRDKKVWVWMNRNWNYSKMFYDLDKDDRDYLYLSSAYIEFCRNTAFVLLLYIVFFLFNSFHNVIFFNTNFLNEKIPFLGGIDLPLIIIIPLCCILEWRLLLNMSSEFEYLFFPRNKYECFARKTQKKNGELLLKRIYGCFIYVNSKKPRKEKRFVDCEVNLVCSDSTKIITQKEISDNNGFWSIPIEEYMLKGIIHIKLYKSSVLLKVVEIELSRFDDPYIEIEL
jgi:hypothetical protein